MEELFGLPAHPLLIHFPIVAIPTLTILTIIAALRPSFRSRYGLPIFALAVVTTIATFLAAQAGIALANTYANADIIDTHRALGETLRLIVLGLLVAFGIMLVADRRSENNRDPLTVLSAVGVLALAVLSAIWTVRTGHEGASVTWGFR